MRPIRLTAAMPRYSHRPITVMPTNMTAVAGRMLCAPTVHESGLRHAAGAGEGRRVIVLLDEFAHLVRRPVAARPLALTRRAHAQENARGEDRAHLQAAQG